MNPNAIIEYFCIDTPEEIDLEAIALHFGAEVRYESLTGCEGRLIGFKDKAIITINKNSSRRRQRFTLGHELGHWIQDKGTSHICTQSIIKSSWTGQSIETLANKFSASLLMPDKLLRERLNNKKFKIRDVQELADEFEVSLTAMAIRVLKLDLMTGILISSDGISRKYYIRSKTFPDSIYPVSAIDNESFAFKAKDKEIGYKAGCEMPGDMWIDKYDASYTTCYEDSILVASNNVISLISFMDISYLEKYMK